MGTTPTKIIIKRYFIVTVVIIGVIAALSQLFAEPFNDAIINKRKDHKEVRNKRDIERVEGMSLLNQIVSLNVLPDSLSSKAKNLVASHKVNEANSIILYDELKALKNADKIRNFQNLNSFLDAIGNPILLIITGFILLLFFIYRKSIDWLNISKSFGYLSIMYFTVGSVYLIWALSYEMEIHYLIYLAGILISTLFAVIAMTKIIKHLFKPNSTLKENRLIGAIRILFDELLLNIPSRGYLKDDKVNEYTKSNTKVIGEVSKEIGD